MFLFFKNLFKIGYSQKIPKKSNLDKIKYLELVNCPFQGEQLKLINYYIDNTKQIKYDDDVLDKIDTDSLTSNTIDNTKTNDTKTNNTKTTNINNNKVFISQSTAYTTEMQISNFIYQSLDEANNNINLLKKILLQQGFLKGTR